jgi:hypothetical protein
MSSFSVKLVIAALRVGTNQREPVSARKKHEEGRVRCHPPQNSETWPLWSAFQFSHVLFVAP